MLRARRGCNRNRAERQPRYAPPHALSDSVQNSRPARGGARRRQGGRRALSRPGARTTGGLHARSGCVAQQPRQRLSELGRREEALAAAKEAAALYRDLARARPEAFTPNLAPRSTTSPTCSRSSASARRRSPPPRRPSRSAATWRAHGRRPSRPIWPGRSTTSPTGSRSSASARRRRRRQGGRRALSRPGARTARGLHALSRRLAQQPRRHALRARPARGGARRRQGGRRALSRPGARAPEALTPDLAVSLNNLANSCRSSAGARSAGHVGLAGQQQFRHVLVAVLRRPE